MSQIRKIVNADGSLQGYWDERKGWVPAPEFEGEAEEPELKIEDQAADADDAGEPEDPDMDLPELSTLTNDQLRKILEESKIPYHKSAPKAELIKLIVEARE